MMAPRFDGGRPEGVCPRASPEGLSRGEREERLRYQRSFLGNAVNLATVCELFDALEGVRLFIKDRESRFVFVSPSMALQFGLRDAADVILTSDRDYFPPSIADEFLRDDRRVMETGEAMRGKLEMVYHVHSGALWAVTTKLPVHDVHGRVLGVLGVSRDHLGGTEGALLSLRGDGNHRLAKVENWVRANYHQKPYNEELAAIAGMSKRKLSREFHEIYRTTPQNFVAIVRLQAACERLVQTQDSIIDIALDCGFSDQSSFTASFRRFTGMTPRRFRLRWRTSAEDHYAS